ncbi:SIS domain-containing protein [Salinithrix halophila]|uniref:Glutamine--fructose-6-phosphate aminotransferase [isomerizing] n=1 Tax=Salinithrix halophila TaxID=1485204 RepID=A0ABV8JB18_9BACL
MSIQVKTSPPYYMLEEIHSQPEWVDRLFQQSDKDPVLQKVLQKLKNKKRIFFTGCGTSHYTAQAGAALARHLLQEANPVQSVPAAELYHHWELSTEDALLAVTHAGETHMVLELLKKARKCGALTVVLTGFPDSQAARNASYVLSTGYALEKSWAHTISFTLGAALLLVVSAHLAESRGYTVPWETIRSGPEQIQQVLDQSARIQEQAKAFLSKEKWLVAGTGTSLATAHETALKVVETSYIPAIPLDLEQVLHGFLAGCDPKTLLLVSAPFASQQERVQELIRAAEKISLSLLFLAPSGLLHQTPRLPVPECHPLLVPLVHTTATHLFVYYRTVCKGMNPDLIRRDQAPYAAARKEYR